MLEMVHSDDGFGFGLDSSIEFSDIEKDANNKNTRSPATPNGSGRWRARVNKWVIIIFLLSATAMVFTIVALKFTSSEEWEDFQADYEGIASRLTDAFHTSAQLRVWVAYSLSAALTSESVGRWPNVTMKDFHRRTLANSFIAQASQIVFAPILRTASERKQWEAYAIENRHEFTREWQQVYQQQVDVQGEITTTRHQNLTDADYGVWPQAEPEGKVEQGIYSVSPDGSLTMAATGAGVGPFAPIWQVAPIRRNGQDSGVMLDLFSLDYLEWELHQLMTKRKPILSKFTFNKNNDSLGSPSSVLLYPIFDSFEENSRVVGVVTLRFDWISYFEQVLPRNTNGLVAVLSNLCGQNFTFQFSDGSVRLLGEADLHDSKYDEFEAGCDFSGEGELWSLANYTTNIEHFVAKPDSTDRRLHAIEHHGEKSCSYHFLLYPSDAMKDEYTSNMPAIHASAVALIFFFISAVFLVTDLIVERCQQTTVEGTARSSTIVRTLCGLFEDSSNNVNADECGRRPQQPRSKMTVANPLSAFPSENKFINETPKFRLKTFLWRDYSSTATAYEFDSEPIAELFPEVTIMFGDISNFTAWSSEREPAQVFILLETIYRAFDNVAKRLGVFKVETIGDCYVAIAGLPDPSEHHASIMTHFAYECLKQMKRLTRELETLLGPGTSDLTLRVGLHSGPVIAGVLRGDNPRFQLFGDAVNTAACMESTGEANCIHASQETIDLLVAEGKGSWVTPREDPIHAKGKGIMNSGWLKPRRTPARRGTNSSMNEGSSVCSSSIDSSPTKLLSAASYTLRKGFDGSARPGDTSSLPNLGLSKWGNLSLDEALGFRELKNSQRRSSQKRARLIDWNVDLLLSFILKIVENRPSGSPQTGRSLQEAESRTKQKVLILEEVTEIIEISDFDAEAATKPTKVVLPPDIREQLHDYVSRIAQMYREIPFHNLEHASHVTMSAVKLMRRIISPEEINQRRNSLQSSSEQLVQLEKNLHELTFGISSDPLVQFSVVFAALIHDADHEGVTNSQLVRESAGVVTKFGEKSTAEQNSIYVAWNMMMEPQYAALRGCIYETEEELKQFRQLMVNSVMATDIMDVELQGVRRQRWDKAFKDSSDLSAGMLTAYDRNRKATSVIEHIIQASDVAHTMQHWHVFRRWNERLLEEMYLAYMEGRMEKDPSVGWYGSQIWFFDNYIIPLARKLKECGVFGVAGSEYLSYAIENRKEWELKGEEETATMLINIRLRHWFCKEGGHDSAP